MLVYRICHESEVNKIFQNKSFQDIGSSGNNNDNSMNSFSYDKTKKYLHFFKDKDNILYLNTSQKHFICTYDIPNYLHLFNQGFGYYYDLINFQKIIDIEEYAITNDKIIFDYLILVERIKEYLDIDDYLEDRCLSKLEKVYSNNSILKLSSDSNQIMALYDILMSNNIVNSIQSNLNLLINLIPEINYMIGFEHKHPHHHLDVWEHTLYALSLSIVDFGVRLSLLLHDIGKPFSYSEKDSVRHFYNHANISATMVTHILSRLGFNKEYISKISNLVKYHDTPIREKDILDDIEFTCTRYLIQECDALAHNPNKLEKRKEYLDRTKKLILSNNKNMI